jgi:serine/threonine-protein kinase RsbW
VTESAAHLRVLQECSRPECLDRIHQAMEELWAEVTDVDQVDRMLFEIAVIEVAGNVVRHGGGDGGFDCQITLRVFDRSLEATFCDTGRRAEVDIAGADLPEEDSEHGRGLAMARDAVDELSYERVDGTNCWRIRRDRVART